jgi:nicotinamide-nucleotide amidase
MTLEPLTLRLFSLPALDPRPAEEFLSTELPGVRFENAATGNGEIEVTVHGVPTAQVRDRIVDVFGKRHGLALFSTDRSTVDDIVADRLRGRRLIVVEGSTEGLLQERLIAHSTVHPVAAWVSVPSVEIFDLMFGAAAEGRAHDGPAGPRTAEHIARLALGRWDELALDTAIVVTGLLPVPGAGPDGPLTGSLCAMTSAGGMITCRQEFGPGPREVRDQQVTLAMHMLRVLRGPERLRVDGQVDT